MQIKLNVIELDKVEELIYRSFFVDLTSNFNNKELNFIKAQRYLRMKHRLSVIIS